MALIVAKNAILQLDGDELKTTKPTPRLFVTNALDYPYNPDADCPQWLEFLDQLWGIKSDCVTTLQEIFGYLLTDDTSQQKIIMSIGTKRSGKGTIARVARGLIGAHNVCNPILGALAGDFGLEPLYGKRLAIVGDARLSGRADAGVIVERLLSISGEDPQTINRKYRSPVTTQLKTRFWLISNELPRLSDASGTIASRFIILPFIRSFYGQEDSRLTDKLLTERPGILNWALCGLRRLRARGRFVMPADAQEMVNEMEELSSPVVAFLNECCDLSPGCCSPVDDIFQAWKAWCASKGRKPANQQTLGRDLRAAVPMLKVTQPRIAGRRIRTYEGIQLKKETDF